MTVWKEIAIKSSATIHDAISIIDKGSMQIAIVVEESGRLLGTITDGDIRRGLLKGVALDKPVEKIMNKSPITLPITATHSEIHNAMKEKKIHQMILVDEEGSVRNVVSIDDYLESKCRNNKVILMAGGLGTRLMPLTEDCPKPLIKVGNSPILETVIRNFSQQGFNDIIISVNYKGEMIKEFCGDGSRFGVNISYVNETKRLGTAGALSLVEDSLDAPVVVMNADLLTRIDFKHFIDFHNMNNSQATMAVREYNFEVPYGVVKTDGATLKGIVEKPQQSFFVNAGIYVLNPEVLKLIPKDEFFDMPQLFNRLAENDNNVSVFPLREYWIDIGRAQELERANNDYQEIFVA